MEARKYEIRNLIPTEHDIAFLTTIMYIAHYPTRSPIPDAALARHIPPVPLWIDQWGKKGDMALVASQGDELIGAACCRLFSVHDCVAGFVNEQTPVLLLAVLPQYRKHGVGRRLLTTLMQRAKDASSPALSLAVSIRNPAIVLYERMGFRSVQISQEFLVTMWASLSPSANLPSPTPFMHTFKFNTSKL
jgi:GNAT superfamily N-acetyltransferase